MSFKNAFELNQSDTKRDYSEFYKKAPERIEPEPDIEGCLGVTEFLDSILRVQKIRTYALEMPKK
jgi:hypothetical protein